MNYKRVLFHQGNQPPVYAVFVKTQWTKVTKPTISFTKIAKPSISWTKIVKPTA